MTILCVISNMKSQYRCNSIYSNRETKMYWDVSYVLGFPLLKFYEAQFLQFLQKLEQKWEKLFPSLKDIILGNKEL